MAIAPWRGQLLYALTTPDMGGLYVKDPVDDAAPESSGLSERGPSVRRMSQSTGRRWGPLSASIRVRMWMNGMTAMHSLTRCCGRS